ncbi:metallophosphoesterase [Sulfurimonas sp. HSL-1716]|uniref:metallophosphoesterase n=1 Tax=Hydrocurvibacter sulfurireducens TaxID=3131937 RepID=UPI0031F7F993
MNALMFGTIFSAVFVLLNLYIHKRLIEKLDLSKKIKHFLNIFLLVNFFGIVAYISARYYINIPSWLYYLLSLPIGVLFLLFCTAVVYDVSRLVLSIAPISSSRRNFFKRSLDISSLFVAVSLSARAMYEARFVEVEKVSVKIKGLARPYKIAQISDLHIGGLIGREFIKEVVQKVNALTPDLIVITGDLVDVKALYAKDTTDEFKELRSKYGTYYIVGNHEYFHGIKEIIKAVKALGIRVLENENVYIGEEGRGFNLAGVYDVFGYRTKTYMPDLQKALQGIKDSPTVLLAHQPRFIEEVKEKVDLMLSGHTHGGQIYPFKFLISLVQPYISGLHRHRKDLQIYVNKGTGFWGPPMRLGANSEITDMTLEPS